jgi:hypothetical protein
MLKKQKGKTERRNQKELSDENDCKMLKKNKNRNKNRKK